MNTTRIEDWVASTNTIQLDDSEDYVGLNFGQSFDIANDANIIIAGSNNTVDGQQGVLARFTKKMDSQYQQYLMFPVFS